MRRVLVTGATGFLGREVVRALADRGDEPVASGRDAARLGDLRDAGLRTLSLDLSDREAVAEACGTPGPLDAVVHCAALSSPWGSRSAFEAANVTGTRSAVALARAGGARRLVHISSPSVCFAFRDRLMVREDEPLPAPANAYAATKAVSEALVLGAGECGPIVLRPRAIYGRGDTTLLPRLLRAARSGPLPLMRDGLAVTDPTHVSDVVGAVLAALDAATHAEGHVVNVSGGEPVPMRRMVEESCARAGLTPRWRRVPVRLAMTAAAAMEAVARWRPGRPEPRATRYAIGTLAYSQTLDPARARALLGWEPRIGFDEGLALTFEGSRNDRGSAA